MFDFRKFAVALMLGCLPCVAFASGITFFRSAPSHKIAGMSDFGPREEKSVAVSESNSPEKQKTPEEVHQAADNEEPRQDENSRNPQQTQEEQQRAAFEAFVMALSGQESGGDYYTVNGRTGAAGKFQIMPGNWFGWAREAGLSGYEPMTAEYQEYVARCKLWDYYIRYGLDGACVAWYAGEDNAVRWVLGKPDAIGAYGHFSWDARQGDGSEPSVREYVSQIVDRYSDIMYGGK